MLLSCPPIFNCGPPAIGDALTEHQALAELKAIAGQNLRYKSCIGMGYTPVLTPPVILRNMLENPGWYTAYTPYQPEVSQGRLEALLNFQQVTLDLTGLDIASASLLDEATAAAEAMAMAKRVSKVKNANRFFVADDVHPQTLDVVRTRAETFGFEILVDKADKVLEHQDIFGVLLQQAGTTGEVHDYTDLIAELNARKVIVSVASDFMALVLPVLPQNWRDIVFGSAQRFGVPMGYGGPHAAFFAARDEHKRSMPAASSASHAMPQATPRCVWRCRRANSISAVRKPTPTSVLPRCCWRTSPACMRCFMDRLASNASHRAFIASPISLPPVCKRRPDAAPQHRVRHLNG